MKLYSFGVPTLRTQTEQKWEKRRKVPDMPALRQSDGSTLKRKASKIIKANLQKKKKGPTNDTVSVASTPPETPTQTSENEANESAVVDIDSEDADAELGTSLSGPLLSKRYSDVVSVRAFEKRLERTHLCLLPAYPRHWS